MKVCCLHKTAHAYVLVTELRFVGGRSRPRKTKKAKIPQKIYGAHIFYLCHQSYSSENCNLSYILYGHKNLF